MKKISTPLFISYFLNTEASSGDSISAYCLYRYSSFSTWYFKANNRCLLLSTCLRLKVNESKV